MAISSNKQSLQEKKKPTSSRLFFVFALATLFMGCKAQNNNSPPTPPTYKEYSGSTMGTRYNIIFEPHTDLVTQAELDSLLIDINLAVSTYIDNSIISKINRSEQYGEKIEIIQNGAYVTTHKLKLPTNPHFISNFKTAQYIYLKTDGYFDPTVMPLVNYWGFGYSPKVAVTQVDSNKVSQLLSQVGLDKFTLEVSANEMICIKPADAQLDFSANAKGYAVDYLSNYLKDKGVVNLMVEIGGEVYAEGLSPSGRRWVIGINTPDIKSTVRDFSNYISLNQYALASSGNYRNYHEVDGKQYGHELNPFTGYPERNDLLGVSVIAPTCADADAYATAMMVMGRTKARKFAEQKLELEALLFYTNEQGELDFDHTSGYFSERFLPPAPEETIVN